MILPEDLQHFSEPTLIVLADHVHAQFWLAHLTVLEQKDAIALPRERKTDNETSFVNTDHGSGSGPELLDDDRQKHFIKMMAEHITSLVSRLHVHAIDLVMSAELAHAIKNRLSQNEHKLINRELHADLMKDDVMDVMRRLRALK